MAISALRHAISVVFLITVVSADSAFAGAFDQTAVTAGMQVWRTKLDSKGRACAYCHGTPDAFDLAFFNFTEADLQRRDAAHIPTADADKIVALVREIRKKYDIIAPKDPRTFRPFQPGGALLSGTTLTERDSAMAAQLQTKLPTLATGNVNSSTVAETAITEVLNYNLVTEKTGVKLPLWSADKFFGLSQARLTDWIADEALIPLDSAALTTLLSLQDTYLADPTEANFWKVYDHVANKFSVTSTVTNGNQRNYFRKKYLSSLIGAHDLRMQTMGRATILGKNGKHSQQYMVGTSNKLVQPVFELGDPNSGMGTLSSEVMASLDSSLSSDQHHRAGQLAWWWIGWMHNPALQVETERQEYFPNSLIAPQPDERRDQGSGFLITHALLLRTKSDVALYRLPTPGTNQLTPYWTVRSQALPPFGANNPETMAQRSTPTLMGTPGTTARWLNSTHYSQAVKLACNASKMRLYMIKKTIDDERAAGKSYRPMAGQSEHYDYIEFRNCIRQLNQLDSADNTHNNNLVSAIRVAQQDWKDGSTSPASTSGTGLKAEIYDSLSFSTLLATRTDPLINFDQGLLGQGGSDGLIYSGAGADVSIRWTGFYMPKYTDTYNFQALLPGIDAQDPAPPVKGNVRIWVNNVLVVDRWNGTWTAGVKSPGSTTVSLTAGVKYPIKVEYSQGGSFQMLSVWHQGSSKQLLGTIPQSQLYPQ